MTDKVRELCETVLELEEKAGIVFYSGEPTDLECWEARKILRNAAPILARALKAAVEAMEYAYACNTDANIDDTLATALNEMQKIVEGKP